MIENNFVVVLLSNVEKNLEDFNVELEVQIREGLSANYEEIDLVKTMILYNLSDVV